MSRFIAPFRGLLTKDVQADRVVPPSGFTAQLTVFAAAAMAFLVVFALALSLAAGRLAEKWGDELGRSATIRITATADQQAAQTEAALRILETTRGVEVSRALSTEEQAALLAPWFGTDLALDALPVPQLIEVIETSEGMDAASLRLRLAAEVPGAVLDDHNRWREPLVQAAARLRSLGALSILLIAAVTGAMVTLAANAALAANAQVIAVLRLVGATDAYIANAFIRRFTLRTLLGAVGGMVLGMLAMFALPSGDDEAASFLTGLGFRGLHWLLPLVIPPLAAAVAFLATRRAARRTLEGLS